MRRLLFLAVAVLLPGAAAFFACTRADETPAGPADLPPEPEIRVSGSETLFPLLERLIQAYTDENPRARVRILPGTSTAGGVAGVRSGALDLGTCSRPLRRDEAAGLAYHLLGYDPIAFAAHPSGGAPRLDAEAVRGIYRGAIRNWAQVDGVDHDILPLDRKPGQSVRRTLMEEFFGPGFRMTEAAVVLARPADMTRALATTPYTIGYAGRAELRSLGLDVRAIPPAGRWPRPDEVRSGAFRLVVPLGVVSRPSPRPEVVRFLAFLTGPRAASVLDALGAVPTNP